MRASGMSSSEQRLPSSAQRATAALSADRQGFSAAPRPHTAHHPPTTLPAPTGQARQRAFLQVTRSLAPRHMWWCCWQAVPMPIASAHYPVAALGCIDAAERRRCVHRMAELAISASLQDKLRMESLHLTAEYVLCEGCTTTSRWVHEPRIFSQPFKPIFYLGVHAFVSIEDARVRKNS